MELTEQIQQILIKVTGIESKIDMAIDKNKEHSKLIEELYNERNRLTGEVIRLSMQIKIISVVGSSVGLGLVGGLVTAFLKIILK